jgi:hypothetical protein
MARCWDGSGRLDDLRLDSNGNLVRRSRAQQVRAVAIRETGRERRSARG